MLIFVVVANFCIGLGCLFAARKVYQLKFTLASVTETLTSLEKTLYNILHYAPDAILKGQAGAQGARQKYAELELQIQKIERVMNLFRFGRLVWRNRMETAQPRTGLPRTPRKI